MRSSRLHVVSDRNYRAPTLREAFDPDDTDTIWFAWDRAVPDASITASEFIVPAGWTIVSARANSPVSDVNDTVYAKANSVTLSTSEMGGLHHIVNRVTFSTGERLDRGVYIKVSQRL